MVPTAPVPILLYHSVSERPHPAIRDFSVPPAVFRRHLDLIVASGRRPVTVSDLVAARRAGRSDGQEVVITFDDGFADLLVDAAPELAARGLPSTAYLTTGALRGAPVMTAPLPSLPGPSPLPGPSSLALCPLPAVLREGPMCSWSDLPELASAGMEIGAHSVTHRRMDELAAGQIASELSASRRALEDALGRAVPGFAYPHGCADRRCRELAVEAGFQSACGVRNALSPADDDTMMLARLTVTSATTDGQFSRWLQGSGAPVAANRELLRTRGWRTVRRAGASLRSGPRDPQARDWRETISGVPRL